LICEIELPLQQAKLLKGESLCLALFLYIFLPMILDFLPARFGLTDSVKWARLLSEIFQVRIQLLIPDFNQQS